MPWTIEAPLHVLHAARRVPCSHTDPAGRRFGRPFGFLGTTRAPGTTPSSARACRGETVACRGRLVHPGHRLARRAVVLVLVLAGGGDATRPPSPNAADGRRASLPKEARSSPRARRVRPAVSLLRPAVPVLRPRPSRVGTPRGAPRARRRGGARRSLSPSLGPRRRRRRRRGRTDTSEVVEQPLEERLIHLPVSRHRAAALVLSRSSHARARTSTVRRRRSSEATCD